MVGARSAAMAFNRLLDADIDGAESAHEDAPYAGGPAFGAASRWGFVAVSALMFLFAARRAESAVLPAGAGGAGDRVLLFVHQAIHLVFAPGAGVRLGHRAGRGLDRDARLARSAHPLADRRRHVLDRRIRHHLLVPGLRIRLARRAVQPAAAFGIAGALVGCAALHVLMIACLLVLVLSFAPGLAEPGGRRAWSLALLIYEHSLVKADDLSRVNAAFFTMNGYVSVLFFLFWAADIFLHRDVCKLYATVFEDRV